MYFASDNWAGVSPKVGEAIAEAGRGYAAAYGNDDLTLALKARLEQVFEHEVAFFLVPTGTATNSLALSALCPSYGIVLAHEESHIVAEEAGAPEFITQGARLIGLKGAGNKLVPTTLEAALARLPPADWGHPRPSAFSVTQASECGTVYTVAELTALTTVAKARGLGVHMDGARFANAVASLGCTPAEITWKAGVDALSFGLTKNGAFMAEAVVLFDPARAETVQWRRKRTGHVVSKARFMAAQFLAMLEDGHWLALAGHANAMAARLSAGVVAAGYRLAWPSEANEVFAIVPKALAGRLEAAGAQFHEWPWQAYGGVAPAADETVIRLVASFATRLEDVESFLTALRAG